jgi:TolB-like protein/tetratricopeptide (TPR) repeat protein
MRTVAFGIAGLIVVSFVVALLSMNPGGLRERIVGGAEPGRIDSLAVLPLENLGGNPEQEYFADGMTEALITDLAKIGGLKVISRTSAMRYKGVEKPLPEIANELNVDAVVEGSVLRSGDRVRIMVQLIDAATDQHLWAETYERELRDVLTLQREVARAVATGVRIRLTPGEETHLAAAEVVNPEAYEAYLRGRYYWNKRTVDGLEKSIDYFQQAIQADPNYALAHAGLADAYVILGANDYGVLRPREAMTRAEAASATALRLDETLGEAHASLAISRFSFEWDWLEAETRYKRAIELNPNYATAHHWYAIFLAAMGRHEEAVAEIQKARELDPLSLIINANTGWILYLARQNDRAVEQFLKTLEMDYNSGVARTYLGLAYEQMGDYDKAITEFRGAIAQSESSPPLLSALGHAYAVSGERAEARKLLRQLEGRSNKEYVPPHLIARLCAGLGEMDESVDWLEKAYDERVGDLVFLKVDPVYDGLRSHPRFQDLVRRMNFPE